MDRHIASLTVWHGLLLGYAALTGIEGPLLVALAIVKRRPGIERLFAGAPILVCVWAFTAARVVWMSCLYWQGELAFFAGYPQPYPRSIADDLAATLAQAAQLGWELAVATVVALTLGWALILRWFPRTIAVGASPPSLERMGIPEADGSPQTSPAERCRDIVPVRPESPSAIAGRRHSTASARRAPPSAG